MENTTKGFDRRRQPCRDKTFDAVHFNVRSPRAEQGFRCPSGIGRVDWPMGAHGHHPRPGNESGRVLVSSGCLLAACTTKQSPAADAARLTTSAGNRLDVTRPVAPGPATPPWRALAPFFELKTQRPPVQLETRSPSPFSREMLRPLTLCRASEMFVSGNLPSLSEVITPTGCGNQAPLTIHRTNGCPHWANRADQYGSNLVPISRIDRFFSGHKTG